ncbi:MAG: TolC family protein [Cyclobacteriaceae bacterium]|nr:TolC family protein [Cyclobacteriaceae bacterium]UYN88053.1 MAG: TolC family protein [Cyclobacteriaceae bacterium]
MKYIVTLLFFSVSLVGYSQDSKQTFTLEQCVEYALQNSIAVQNANLDEKIATARVKETVGIGLPQIDGTVSLDHNEQLRRFFSIYDPNSIFLGGQTIPGANVGDVIAAQNFFQLKSSADAGLRVNQLLFNGSYLVGLQAANAYKDLAVKSSLQTREDVVANVTKAYYAVLVNRERIKSFDVNIARVDSLLKDTRVMYENGFAEAIDVDRIRVSLTNLTTERNNFLRLQDIMLERLKFLINYPMSQQLEVAGQLTEEELSFDLDGYLANWNYKDRPDYQVLEANKKLQALNVKNNIALGMPVLSAYANLGYSTQSPNIGGLFTTNTGFSDNGVVGPDKWYSYSSYGLSLRVPVFSGLQRSYKVQQERLALRQIENGERQLKSNIDLEIKQALNNYTSNVETLKAQQQNSALAARVASVTKIKYTEGVGSNFEVVEAETTLRESQVNYYNALFDALIAKVDLEKAFGKFYNEKK